MMNNSLLSTVNARADTATSSVEIPQLRIRGILAVWAAAALPDGSARLARRARARGPVRRHRHRADVQGTDRVSHRRTRLAVRSRRDPRRPRAADAPLVDGPRGALASLPAKPAQRTGRRPDLADRDPADPGRSPRHRSSIPTFAAPENREFATLVGSDAGRRSWTAPGAGTASSLRCSCSPRSLARSSCFAGTSFRA